VPSKETEGRFKVVEEVRKKHDKIGEQVQSRVVSPETCEGGGRAGEKSKHPDTKRKKPNCG